MLGLPLLIGLVSGWAAAHNSEICPPMWEFSYRLFFIFLLPPIVFTAGSFLQVNQLVANFKAIVIRGIFFTLLSFILVSSGAAYLLPKIGIAALTLKDCLVIGAVFSSSNLLFIYQDMDDDQQKIRRQYDIVIGEAVLNAATTFALFRLIKDLDSSPPIQDPIFILQLVAQLLYVFIASGLVGVLLGLSMSFFPFSGFIDLASDNGALVVRWCMVIVSFYLYIINEFTLSLTELSGILIVFFFGMITSHYLLPKTNKSSISWRYDNPLIAATYEILVYHWIGHSVHKLKHWGYLYNSGASFGTFMALSLALLFLFIMGRVPSVYQLSQCIMRKTETSEEASSALLFNRWPVDNVALEKQTVLWLSRLMPSVISLGLAIGQYKNSEETTHALLLISTICVVYFVSLVFLLLSHYGKAFLAQSMITVRGERPMSDKAKAI